MIEKLLTAEQVVDFLRLDSDGCDLATAKERLRMLCRARQIPFVRLPGSRLIRFRAEDIEKLIEQSVVPAVSH